jgi:hypothetical protein
VTRRRTWLITAAFAAAFVVAPGARAAEPLFAGDGTRLSPPHIAAAEDVAVTAWGEAGGGAIRAAIRRAGAWGTSTALPVRAPAVIWDVAVDRRGTALVAVTEGLPFARPGVRVFAAGSNGAWTASPRLAPTGARVIRGLTLAAAPDGTVVVAFERYDPPNGRSLVMAAVRTPAGEWTVARGLHRPEPAYEYGLNPEVAAGPGGRVLVTWSDRGSELLAASRGPGGRWTAPRPLAPSGYASQVGFAPDGSLLALWSAAGSRGLGQVNRVRERSPAGHWGPPTIAFIPGGNGGLGARLVVGPGGHAAIAALPTDGSMLTIHAATRPPGGALTPFRRLTRPMRIPPLVIPALAVDEVGNAGLAWASGGRVRLAVHRAAGGWTPTRAIGAAFRPPALAAIRGRMLVAWVRNGDEIVVREVRA